MDLVHEKVTGGALSSETTATLWGFYDVLSLMNRVLTLFHTHFKPWLCTPLGWRRSWGWRMVALNEQHESLKNLDLEKLWTRAFLPSPSPQYFGVPWQLCASVSLSALGECIIPPPPIKHNSSRVERWLIWKSSCAHELGSLVAGLEQGSKVNQIWVRISPCVTFSRWLSSLSFNSYNIL